VTPYLQVAVRVRDLVGAAVTAGGSGAASVQDVAATRIPACPDWTVHDVVAHLGGVADDVLAGNVADAGRPTWTAAQVQARHDVALEVLLDRWVAATTRMGPAAAGPAATQMTMDALTHELDLRQALAAPLPDVDLTPALEWLVARFDGVLRRRQLPCLRIVATGPGEPGKWLLPGTTADEGAARDPQVAQLAGSQVDLLRSLTGRRTREQVLALLTPTAAVTADDWWRAFTWGPFVPPAAPTEPGSPIA
jgi:uncharacterized protein (TIGR03083 family)